MESESAGSPDRCESGSTAAPSDESPVEVRPITEGPGSRIGPYKLLQEIGEGGMGVVYMAAAFAALLVSATAVSGWQALRATRAEHSAQKERNHALDAEKVAKEQTDRALRAEQTVRAELYAESATLT